MMLRPPVKLTALALLAAASVHAEIMDDIDVRRDGSNAIVQIHMATPVSFLRSTSSRTNDLTQAYYRVRPDLNNPPAYVPGERRVVEAKGLPALVIQDEPVKTGFPQDPNRRLVISLGQPTKFKVRMGKDARTLELVLEGQGSKLQGEQTFLKLSPATLSPGQNYVIALIRSPTPKLNMDLPVPQALQQYQVFTTRRLVQGKQVHEMDLGYFATLAEAESALGMLTARFPQAQIVRLQAEATATTPAEGDVLPLKSASTLLDNEAKARALLEQGRTQYEQRQFDEAMVTLNQALELPVTALTPDAQELLGQVLAATGDKARAEAEFVAYLKQYPEGPGAQRVRDALAALRPTDLKPSSAIDLPKAPEDTTTVTGSVSQYFYGGKISQAQKAERAADGTPLPTEALKDLNQPSLTNDAQRLLSNFADATWRNRNSEREMKFVARDQFDYNLLPREQLKLKSRYRNRLSAVYFDYLGLDAMRLKSRIGRQNAAWGGEGRYDGASGSFSFRPKWKASAAIGSPVDGVADTNRYFMGTSIDADAITPNFGASAFVLQRMIDGVVDRRNVGTDLRYFSGNSSLMGSVDFDTIYRKLNRASLQGNLMSDGGTVLTLISERTALVPVSLSQTLFFQYDALQKQGVVQPRSIKELQTYYSLSQLRQFVRDNTSYFNHAMAALTFPLTTQWQVGGDAHVSSTGAIAPNEANGFANQAATGVTRSMSLQAIGTNLYSERDTNVFSVNASRGRQYRGTGFNFNNMTALDEAWQLEPNFHWMRSVSVDSSTGAIQSSTVAWGPGFRASFKPRPMVTFETNFTLDRTTVKSNGSTVDQNTGQTISVPTVNTTNLFTYSLGYRYEF